MATKPTRVMGKQLFAYVGNAPTRRAQRFDWNSNFTVDSVFELGNAGIVEDSVTLVETAISLTSNEWGTTDLEAMIFGNYEQRNILATGVSNSTGTIYVAAKGAGGDWGAIATANDWLQVIRTTGTANVTDYVKIASNTYVSGSLSNKIGLAAGYTLSGVPGTGDVVSLVNKYTITQDTVDSDPVHLVLPHRYNNTATTIMHSVLLPRCYVDSLTYRIDTGGASEQDYSLVGEEERLVLNGYREMFTTTGSFNAYTNATLTFSIPKDSYASVGSPYLVYGDSTVATLANITHTYGAVTVQAKIGSGLGFDASSQIVYYSYNSEVVGCKGYKGLTNITNAIGKLTKGYVDIYMDVNGDGSTKLLRCTGIDISIPLGRESIDELGESRSIAKPLEGNLRNEVTLTFNRNDLLEYARMQGNLSEWDAGTLKEILMTSLKSQKNVSIYVYFYNSETTHSSNTLLKTMTFTNCNFIGDNSTSSISGATGLELKFSTQTVSIVGSGNPPIYS